MSHVILMKNHLILPVGDRVLKECYKEKGMVDQSLKWSLGRQFLSKRWWERKFKQRRQHDHGFWLFLLYVEKITKVVIWWGGGVTLNSLIFLLEYSWSLLLLSKILITWLDTRTSYLGTDLMSSSTGSNSHTCQSLFSSQECPRGRGQGGECI